MKTTIDYSNSPCKSADAFNDIITYLGEARYNKISPTISQVKDCRKFEFYCNLAGISGYPVLAWYEHYHGQGTWVYASDAKQNR